MNKKLHRVVFNKARGVWMVTAETAASCTKAAGGVACTLSICAALAPPAQAQIVADRNAPRTQQPTVLLTPSGVVQVNIQSPTAAGVSRNTYSQFDVQQNGVVLNNSRNGAVTQTAGAIAGNPWLARGTARIILNEVNSAHPSQLKGYVEVGGDKAQVVIANPAGITCDGCGFINATRATVTTGTPVVQGGNLDGYRVERGSVDVKGAGMDARGADYTDVIARSVQVNAGIWARNLKVTAGANQVNADNSQAASIAGTGAAPAHAIDTALLGGMYANKIVLVGTEAGVGVRNAGVIGAQAGDVVITADGMLHNSGQITATAQVSVDASSDILNSGTVYAGTDARLKSGARIANTGTALLAAAGHTTLEARGAVSAEAGTTIASGLTTTGQGQNTGNGASLGIAGSVGELRIDSASGVALHGTLASAGDQRITAKLIDVGDSYISSGQNLWFAAMEGAFDARGATVLAVGALTVTAHGIDNTGGMLNGRDIHLDAQQQAIENTRGAIIATRGADIHAGEFQNQTGYVWAGTQGLRVDGQALDNTSGGEIRSTGEVRLQGTGLDNKGGVIDAAGPVRITLGTGTLDNTTSLVRSGGTLGIEAAQVINTDTRTPEDLGLQGDLVSIAADHVVNTRGAVWANQDLTLTSAGTLDNTDGLLSSAHRLRVVDTNSTGLEHNTLAITNTRGTLIANDLLHVGTARIGFDGRLYSNDGLDLRLNTSVSDLGDLYAGRSFNLTTTGDVDNAGTLAASQSVSITAANITNTATGEISASRTTLTATGGAITNRGLIDGDEIVLRARAIENIGTGRIYGTDLALGATHIRNIDEPGAQRSPFGRHYGPLMQPWNASWYVPNDNDAAEGGVIAARRRLDIGAATLINGQNASIVSEGDAHFAGALDDTNHATGRGGTVRNASGSIVVDGQVSWNVDHVINERARLVWDTASTTTATQTLLADTGGAGAYRILQVDTTTVATRAVSDQLSSKAGLIQAGGPMNFGDAYITNNASVIQAGGRIDHDPTRYVAPATNVETTTQGGYTVVFYRDKCGKLGGCSFKNHRSETRPFDVVPDPVVVERSPGTVMAAGTVGYADAGDAGAGQVGASLPPAPLLATAAAVQASTPTSTPAPQTIAATLDLGLPASSLFKSNGAPDARFIVTTDARFAGYRHWLDSDYMLRQLGIDPTSLGQRFADGYYEQRLIRDQTHQLLGRRLLDKNENNETEYLALMDNGVLYARSTGLAPGAALTAEQIAALPNDMVWLVRREVTLADGSKTQALVPQVYARVRAATEPITDSAITANRIDYQLAGRDFTNRNHLVARDAVAIRADNIHNLGGRIQGADVSLTAQADINNTGGSVAGTNSLALSAGRDINAASTLTSQHTGNTFVQNGSTRIDRVASFEAGGSFNAEAGRDIRLTATRVSNTGEGGTSLTAQNDIVLDTLTTSQDDAFVLEAGNHSRHARREEVGSLIESQGDIRLSAGRDLATRAARVGSEGVLVAQAGRDLHLASGEQTLFTEDARQSTQYRSFKQTTTTTLDVVEQTTRIGTTLTGRDVRLQAGRDLTLHASSATAAQRLEADAGRDLLLQAGTDQVSQTHERSSFTRASGLGRATGTMLVTTGIDSGHQLLNKTARDDQSQQTQAIAHGSVLSAGTLHATSGRDVTLQASTVVADTSLRIDAGRDLSLNAVEQIGTQSSQITRYDHGAIGTWYQPALGTLRQREDGQASSTTLAGTQLSSLHGSVELNAGGDYRQTASQVLAPEGDIGISGREVRIDAGTETGRSTQQHAMQRTAVGGGVSIPLLSALQSARANAKASKDTDDDRMKGLAALNTALALQDAYGSAAAMAGGGMGGIKVSVSLSKEQSESSTTQSGTNAVGSLVAAGGNVTVRATGGDLAVTGSRLSAGENTHLQAQGAITLQAAENTATQRSDSSSQGASIGVGFAIGGSQNGFTIDLAASRSLGEADGQSSVWTNTQVAAGNRLTLQSGGDLTLRGAVASGAQITTDVGGDLKVHSLQDRSVFDSEQTSSGFAISLCIPPICYGATTVGVNAANSQITGNYLSVTEQSGLKAGDGGYQVKVKGNTELIGGVIASSDAAIAQGRNSFSSAAVSQRDIENRVEFKGEAFAVSVNTGTGTQQTQGSAYANNGQASASAGIGSDEGFQTSLTRSAIGASTREDTAGVIAPIFDADKVQRNLNAQVRITQTFSQVAPKAVADYAGRQTRPVDEARDYQRIREQQEAGRPISDADAARLVQLERVGMNDAQAQATLSDPQAMQNYERWQEGGTYRVALHTAIGALGGGVNGALGAGVNAAAAPVLDDLQFNVRQQLIDSGISAGTAQAISQGVAQLTSAGIGATVGGTAGAGFGLVIDTNNRQLHTSERNLIEHLATERARRDCQGDAACEQSARTAWIDAMERVAQGSVDERAAVQNDTYLQTLVSASADPSSEGARGGLQNYADRLVAARDMLSPYAGQAITVRGQPITADGASQTYFSATTAQRADPYANTFLGQVPSSIAPLAQLRNDERIEDFGARNGAAQPIYPAEEGMLGGAVGTRAARAVGAAIDLAAAPRFPSPFGFADETAFAAFSASLREGLEAAGFREVRSGFQGSSVTGRSFASPNQPFDVGRISDFDIALSSKELFERAQAVGIGLRQQGTRTGPLTSAQIERLGLLDLQNQLSQQAGRPVNFMIYRSFEDAVSRSPTIVVPPGGRP